MTMADVLGLNAIAVTQKVADILTPHYLRCHFCDKAILDSKAVTNASWVLSKSEFAHVSCNGDTYPCLVDWPPVNPDGTPYNNEKRQSAIKIWNERK